VILNIAKQFEMLLHVFRKTHVKYFLETYLDCWKFRITLCKMTFFANFTSVICHLKHGIPGKLFIVHIRGRVA